MKGLIYKEFYISRKRLALTFGTFFIISLFGVLFYLSLYHGNLAKLQEFFLKEMGDVLFNEESLKRFYYSIIYLGFFVSIMGVMFGMHSFERDHKVKWDYYLFSSPATEYKIVGAQYITTLSCIAVSFIFGIINALIISRVSGYAFTFDIFKNFLAIFTAVMILSMFEAPLLYRYKTVNAAIARALIPGLAVYIGVMLYITVYIPKVLHTDIDTFMMSLPDKLMVIRDNVFPFCPLIIIAAVLISYALSVIMLKRREK